MRRAFFIVGPTATGKSELAADVAREIGAEIVSADAFQLYRGLDPLTAKPESSTLAKAPHHLVGLMPLSGEMNAEKYRRAAMRAIDQINSRGRLAIVVGGSGLYIKALTHGLAPLPESDSKLREKSISEALAARSTVADGVDLGSLADVRPRSAPAATGAESTILATGVFVFRHREELYQRINQRVEIMFERGVIEEVRDAGVISATASQMIGLREIRQLLAGKESLTQCITEIQQTTRRYAKRQLTWFRRQTNFLPLNLSFLTHNEAVKWISLRVHSEVDTRND